ALNERRRRAQDSIDLQMQAQEIAALEDRARRGVSAPPRLVDATAMPGGSTNTRRYVVEEEEARAAAGGGGRPVSRTSPNRGAAYDEAADLEARRRALEAEHDRLDSEIDSASPQRLATIENRLHEIHAELHSIMTRLGEIAPTGGA